MRRPTKHQELKGLDLRRDVEVCASMFSAVGKEKEPEEWEHSTLEECQHLQMMFTP